MEETTHDLKEKRKKFTLAVKAGKSLTKMAMALFILLIVIQFFLDSFVRPYNFYIAGFLLCAFLYILFRELRQYTTYRSVSKYDVSGLSTKNEQLEKLMYALDFEINKFESSVSYYFFNVQSFKYATVVLSGLSTVVLGLDLTGVKLIHELEYTKLSKNIALVIGAVLTGVSTMAIYWNLEKYWLQNKIILQKFRQLREEIEFADKKATLTPETVDQYCELFKTIKKEFYKYWEGVQAERGRQ